MDTGGWPLGPSRGLPRVGRDRRRSDHRVVGIYVVVLAVGAIFWLVAAAVMVTGFLRARQELPEPRPGFWSIRKMLIYDTVHARSATGES